MNYTQIKKIAAKMFKRKSTETVHSLKLFILCCLFQKKCLKIKKESEYQNIVHY